MACTTASYSVANTIKNFRIQSLLHNFYQQNLYPDKQEVMNELLHRCHLPLLKYIDHPELITEWKQNIDSSAYKKYINR